MDAATVLGLLIPRKPLRRLVPQLDELLARPAVVLAVVIDPAKTDRAE